MTALPPDDRLDLASKLRPDNNALMIFRLRYPWSVDEGLELDASMIFLPTQSLSRSLPGILRVSNQFGNGRVVGQLGISIDCRTTGWALPVNFMPCSVL